MPSKWGPRMGASQELFFSNQREPPGHRFHRWARMRNLLIAASVLSVLSVASEIKVATFVSGAVIDFLMPLAYWVHDLSPFLIRFSENFGIRYYGLAYVLGFAAAWLLLLHY